VGAASEDVLSLIHQVARNRKIALVDKVPSGWKIIRRVSDVEFVCVPSEKTGVDYRGVLKGGRALFVECKSCSSGTFDLKGIQANQLSELDAADDLGAACVLAIVWDPPTTKAREALSAKGIPAGVVLVAVPWPVVRELRKNDAKSIPSDVLVEHAGRWEMYAK